jgi:alkyl hydroperoxide reductase subunit AhpF
MAQRALKQTGNVLVKGMTSLAVDSETLKVPSRTEMMNRLKKNEEYDLLIIGGGATGAGSCISLLSLSLFTFHL